MPQLWAFIVTISVYKNLHQWPATGASSDGANMIEFLTRTMNPPPGNIRHLAEEGATRREIISTFKAHLIENRNIEKGDPILFYFSGHGTRLNAPVGWTVVEEKTGALGVAGDDMVEAIVPYDESELYEEDEYKTFAIPDRTLAALLKSVARNHGNNITVILDCCHSGHGTRGNDTSILHGEELTVRALPGARLSPFPPFPDDDIIKAASFSYHEWDSEYDPLPSSIDKDTAVVDHASLPISSAGHPRRSSTFRGLLGHHVLIAACRPRERAEGGESGGVLTKLFLAAMQANLHPQTYAHVVKYINRQLSTARQAAGGTDAWGQHPQCEGIYRDRLVFKETMMKVDHFNAKFQGRGGLLSVDAGEIHGVRRGTVFEIFELADSLDETKVGDAEAREVYAQSSVVRMKSGLALQAATVYTAAIIREIQLRYAISGSLTQATSTLARLRDSLPRTNTIVEVPSIIDADVAFQFEVDGAITLQRLDPLLGALGPENPTPQLSREEANRANFDQILRGIAKFNWLLSFSNPAQPFVGLVTLRMLRFTKIDDDEDSEGIFVIPREDGEPVDISPDRAQLVDDDHEYAIVLENRSSIDLHVQVWYLDPDDYSIKNLYEPVNEDQPSLVGTRAGSDQPGILQIGASTEHEWLLRYFVPTNAPCTTLYALVFLSSKSVRLGSLEQDALFGPEASDERAVREGEVDREGQWDVIRQAITVTKV